MYRYSAPLSLLISIVYCLACFGCGSKRNGSEAGEHYPIDRADTISVELKEISDTKIVIYHTEPATIIVSYSYLIDNLQAFINKNNVADDIALLEKLRVMASETDSLDIAGLTEELRLIERFQFRLADMLQNGVANVYHKMTGEAVKSILVERFEFRVHKMAGRGGRRFYLPNHQLFLEVIDWIS